MWRAFLLESFDVTQNSLADLSNPMYQLHGFLEAIADAQIQRRRYW
jgi:hypothetical protein